MASDEETTTTCETETGLPTDRNRLVKEHLWLVRCIAGSIMENLPRTVDADDLISAGTMGLIRAVDDFDPSRGASLQTYARYRIRGAILDELRRQDVLPYSVRSKVRQIEKAMEDLEIGLGRYPTDEELSEKVGISAAEISRLLATAASLDLYSLDEIFERGEGELAVELEAGGENDGDPLSRLEREELVKVVVEALRELPKTEKAVLGLYYYEGLRMKEIGEIFGISESRVSQIHSKAILLLRSKLRIGLLR
jgi:RNA polymerase sigma factor for flagellar operon FliA